jgi:hypothetical protein
MLVLVALPVIYLHKMGLNKSYVHLRFRIQREQWSGTKTKHKCQKWPVTSTTVAARFTSFTKMAGKIKHRITSHVM